MARLGDFNPQATHFTNTMCPGTDVYMPPEAVQDKPMYTEKIDCFSFGVIIVQILTRQFPKPGDRLQEVELNHPGLRTGTVLVRVSEVDRRQNHISQIDPNHSLLPIVLNCLRDKDDERPSAHRLCERVAALKRMPKYRDSARTVQDKDEVIQSLAVQMKEKDRMISSKEEENLQLRQQLQERDQANRQLEEREGQLKQQLQASEKVVAQFEKRIVELEQQLSQREQQKPTASSKGKELTSFKLRWREGKRAPRAISRSCDAVVDGNTVYVRSHGMVKMYSYDATSDSWSQLPDCIHVNDSIAVINGLLTTVGGYSYPTYSNELFSLTREGSGRRWIKKFPPMATKRYWTTSLCTGTTLIVAGGMGEGGRVLSIIEVMNTETHQWSTAADLPQPIYSASATVCGDRLYMLGGENKGGDLLKSVYACSVSALLQSCVLCSLEASIERTSLIDKAIVWRQVADSPFIQSTCGSIHGRLLAIGGKELGKPTTTIYMYNSTANCWEIISHMTTGRFNCCTAVLSDNRLVVVGGKTDAVTTVSTVEISSICN